jgi:tRNA pseudouridine38-40 synthase
LRNLRLTLAYDGTALVGWQRQPSGRSVQGLLEEALARIEGTPVTVIGAGRTDAGVHAASQVANVWMAAALACDVLQRALNATLPPDVRVLAVEHAPDSFHARFGARAKTYHYCILNGAVVSPFLHRYVWHVPYALDVERMARAAAALEGQHDFASFQSSGSIVSSAIRRIERAVIRVDRVHSLPWLAGERTQERLLAFEITGSGFLRHMVRAMVGTLVEVGAGRLGQDAIPRILAARHRGRAGPTAPAAGLWLSEVRYDGPPLAASR